MSESWGSYDDTRWGLTRGNSPWDLQRLGTVWLHKAGIKCSIIQAAQPRRVHVVAHGYDEVRVHISSLDCKQTSHLCLVVRSSPAKVPYLYKRAVNSCRWHVPDYAHKSIARRSSRSQYCMWRGIAMHELGLLSSLDREKHEWELSGTTDKEWYSVAGTHHHEPDRQVAAVFPCEQRPRQEQDGRKHSHTSCSPPPCFPVGLLL